jgi:uncharacterized OB-fold protein
MDRPPPIPPPPIDYESTSQQESPPLWRELIDGTAGIFAKVAVCVALAPLMVGVGLVVSFVVAGIVPGGMRGYGPDDDIVAVVLLACGFVYVAAVAWVWTRQRRRHKALWKALAYTGCVVAATIVLGALVDTTLRRAGEILIVALIFLGISAILLIWIHALRSYVRYRPPTHSADGMLDVRCPTCGYRMVGLHESRCPECGTGYTLDDLLAQQAFIARSGPPMRPAPMSPPAVAHVSVGATANGAN